MSSQAGSALTKVKLFVVDTADPSRRTQVAASASVASRWVSFINRHLGVVRLHPRSTLRRNNDSTPNSSRNCVKILSLSVAVFLSDHILCSVTWPTDTRIAAQWLTRKQNYVIVQIYDFDGSSWQEKQVAVTFQGSCGCLTAVNSV